MVVGHNLPLEQRPVLGLGNTNGVVSANVQQARNVKHQHTCAPSYTDRHTSTSLHTHTHKGTLTHRQTDTDTQRDTYHILRRFVGNQPNFRRWFDDAIDLIVDVHRLPACRGWRREGADDGAHGSGETTTTDCVCLKKTNNKKRTTTMSTSTTGSQRCVDVREHTK